MSRMQSEWTICSTAQPANPSISAEERDICAGFRHLIVVFGKV
jgi:hypothetical protein